MDFPETQVYAPLTLAEISAPESTDGYTLLSSLVAKIEQVTGQTQVLEECVSVTRDLLSSFRSLLQQLKPCLWGDSDIRKLKLGEQFHKISPQSYRDVFPKIEAVLHEIFKKYDIIRDSSRETDSLAKKTLVVLVAREIMDDLANLLMELAGRLQEIGIRGATFPPAEVTKVKTKDREDLLERLKETIQSKEGKKQFPIAIDFARAVLEDLPENLSARAAFKALEEQATKNIHQAVAKKCESMSANMGQEEFVLDDKILASGTFGPIRAGHLQGPFYKKKPRIVTKEISRLNFLSIESRREIQVNSIRYHRDKTTTKFESERLCVFYGTLLVEEEHLRQIFLIYAEYPRTLSQFLWSEHFVDVNAEPLESKRVLKYATDIMEGLRYLHRNSIHHGGLYPTNMFMTEDDRLVLANFGFEATKREYRRHANYNAMTYLAPEAIRPRRQQWTFAGDMYSFGVVLWELLEGHKAFEDIEFSRLIRMVERDRMRPRFTARPDKAAPPSFIRKLVTQCWQHHPANRPTANEVLSRIENEIAMAGAGKARKSFTEWYTNGEYDMLDEVTTEEDEIQVVHRERINHEGLSPLELVRALDTNLDAKTAVNLLIEIYSLAINDRKVRTEVAENGIGPLLKHQMQHLREETDVIVVCLRLIWCLGKGQRKAAVDIEETLVKQLVHESIVECMLDHEDVEDIQIEGYNALRELCLKSQQNVETIARTNAIRLCYRQLRKGYDESELAKSKEALRLLSYLLVSEAGVKEALTVNEDDDGNDVVEKLLDANTGEDQDASIEYFGEVVTETIREYQNKLAKEAEE